MLVMSDDRLLIITPRALNVRYNYLQDQLVLTSGTDARVSHRGSGIQPNDQVVLANISSLSSNLYTHVDGESLHSEDSIQELVSSW